jgi:predicted RNA-binding protein with PIN domain
VESLPADIEGGIVRGVGRWLKNAPPRDVPAQLRRFRSFRPATLLQHRVEVLAALEDDEVRATIGRWLDEAQPKLPKPDGYNLRLAVDRPEDWRERLVSAAAPRSRPRARPQQDETLDAERTRARSARAELKRARQHARTEIDAAQARVAELTKEISRLKGELAGARDLAAAAEASAESARAELDRGLRKARREVDKARSERDELKADARSTRRSLSATTRELERLRRRIEQLERDRRDRPAGRPPRPPQPAEVSRRPLRVPKGRLPEDPQTLDEWLANPRVHLVVDGYNAARAPGAFGDLDLEAQRERLIEAVSRLAVRREAAAIVVFDGAEIAPGTRRRRRGPVAIEYSRASETADDHMVALLDRLPPDPVVVVTNDRELQDRTAARGATIATSDQLMGLIR